MSGDPAGAEKVYREALHLAKEAQSLPLLLDALAGLALSDARSGKNEQALGLAYSILNHPASTQETKDRASQVLSEAENCLNITQVQAIKKRVSGPSLEAIAERFAKAKQPA